MTLKETIRIIEKVAREQPTINTIIRNDIYKLNSKGDARYGVFAWTQGQHRTSLSDNFMHFQFNLFYVDRLIEDERNQIDIQTTGVVTLTNICKILQTEYDLAVDNEIILQPFNQQFADDCAGVFCTITMSVLKDSSCEEIYPDFNDDFNNDFLIF